MSSARRADQLCLHLLLCPGFPAAVPCLFRGSQTPRGKGPALSVGAAACTADELAAGIKQTPPSLVFCSEAKAAPETSPHRFSCGNSFVHTVPVLCCALSRQLWKSSLGSAGLSMQGSLPPPAGTCCSLVSNDPRGTWAV